VAARHATDFSGGPAISIASRNPRPAIPSEIIQVYLTSLSPTVAVPLGGRPPISHATNTCVVTIASSGLAKFLWTYTSLGVSIGQRLHRIANGSIRFRSVAGRPTPPGKLTIER
jgi:hypothetical protein